MPVPLKLLMPKTLSASALQVAGSCMSRFVAEYEIKARGISSMAANTGTACHGALEKYVHHAYIAKDMQPTLAMLLAFFDQSFEDTFGSLDKTRDEYKLGIELLENWHTRSGWMFAERKVLTVEKKDWYHIDLTLADGTVHDLPVTYIMDRVDMNLDETELYVEDYKTNAIPISAEELKRKIQARLYALIALIEYLPRFPNLRGVWVAFDMLKHERVGVFFTREECLEVWNWLMREVTRICNTEAASVKETLNPECGFCIRKASCRELKKNIDAGGIMSLTPQGQVDMLVRVDGQKAALASLSKELSEMLGAALRVEDDYGTTPDVITGTAYDAILSARAVRSVDANRVAAVVPPEVIRDYLPPSKLTMEAFTRMCKDERLPAERVKVLKSLVSKTVSIPTVKVVKRTDVEPDL